MKFFQKEIELRSAHAINMHSYQRVVCLRRCMAVATGLTLLAVIIFIIALFLPSWSIIDFVNTEFEHVNVQLGVLGEYRTVNTTNISEWIPHFPESKSKPLRLADSDLKTYYIGQIALAAIALTLMIANNIAAFLTFCYHRFVYKRVVAVVHFVIACCVYGTVEVISNSITEWNTEVAQKKLVTDWTFSTVQTDGCAHYLAVLVVVIYVVAGIVFLAASTKQKGSRAATAEFEIEDRPIHMGR